MLWSTLLWLFQVVHSVLIVSVRGRLLYVVAGCSFFSIVSSCFMLFQVFSHLRLVHIDLRRLACLKCCFRFSGLFKL